VEQIVAEISRNLDILTSGMRDIPARQRSMRAVFEQTWDLLTADEQAAFRALSVFRGGFTEEAAVQVAGISPYLLLGLLDRGLVQRLAESRYEIHELTRQFAAEKLKTTAIELQEQVAQKHSAYYLNLAAHYDQPLHGEDPVAPMAILKAEIDNIRQAWHWAASHKQVDLFTNTIDAVAAFYEYAGLIAEGERIFGAAAQEVETQSLDRETRELLCNLLVKHLFFAHIRGVSKEIEEKTEKVFALSRELNNQERLADSFLIRGFTLEFTGEYEAALEQYQQARALYQELNQERELAVALNQIGETLVFLSAPGKAEVYHLQSLKIGFSSKDLRLRALSLSYLGVVYYYLDDYPQAVSYWEQAISLFEVLEDARGLGRTTNNIAHVHNLLGNYQAGLENITRALSALRQIGDVRSEAAAYDTMGTSYFGLGDYGRARECYQQAFQRAQDTGTMQQYEASFLTSLAVLNSAEGRYDEAEAQLRRALETIKELEPPREIANTLASLANLYSQTGRHAEALDYYDEALETLKQVGEKSEMAPILIQKAGTLFELGDLEQAQRLNNSGLEIAHATGRKPAIFQGRLLTGRLAHALGRADEAVEILRKILDEFTSETERAETYFEMWHITGEREAGEKALALYQNLSSQTPNAIYRRRLGELQQSHRLETNG
jgi:tetratricopeptide (TPR) repeat protein